MGTTEAPSGEESDAHAFDRPLPEYVDWIVGTAIVLFGLALTVGGSALTFVVDRDMIREDIESGEITVILFEQELSEAEMLEFTLDVVNWTGAGLLITGAGLVVFAVGFVVVRHRAHQRMAEGESIGSYWAHAVVGAVATTVLAFLPFSPVFGGGLAGYLEYPESGRSVSAGALSGFLFVVPGLSILGFVTAGLFAGLSGIGESGFGIVVTAAMLLVLLFVAAYGTGLSALGGFLGGRLAEN